MAELSAKTLELNDIGVAEVYTDRGIVFERYGDDRDLGGFILIDKVTNATVGAGLIKFALRRSQNVHWQAIEISREAHAAQKSQRPHLLRSAEHTSELQSLMRNSYAVFCLKTKKSNY